MYFFKDFPKEKFNYQFNTIVQIDITTRVKLLDYVKNNQDSLSILNYEIKNEKKPEQISLELYDTTDYTWTILILNDVYDIYNDWVKPQIVLENELIQKYGSLEESNRVPAHYYSEFGYEIGESSLQQVQTNFNDREKNYTLLHQTVGFQDEYSITELGDLKFKQASKTYKGRVIENRGPIVETVFEKTMRENDEKKLIRVFDSRVIFRIQAELSSLLEQ